MIEALPCPGSTEEDEEAAKEKMRATRDRFKAEADLAKKAKWEEFVTNVAAENALSKFWKLRKKVYGQCQSRAGVNVKDETGRTLEIDNEKRKAFLAGCIKQTHQGNIDARKEVERDFSSVLKPESYENLGRGAYQSRALPRKNYQSRALSKPRTF